jgi:hydrogenase maturation protease
MVTDDLVDRLARTLLYEGYLLYPYRPSAVKNRQRFNFGVLYPSACCQGDDRSQLQAECPVEMGPDTEVSVSLRFLQLVERPAGDAATRQEAVERQIAVADASIAGLRQSRCVSRFRFADQGGWGPAVSEGEACDRAVEGMVELGARAASDGVDVLTVRVSNLVDVDRPVSRDEALLGSLVSAHVLVTVRGGRLVSLLDPPDPLRAVAEGCRNLGVWPVLVGGPGSRDCMLASPIILYDYPQIAPESAGDLFDGTEIDEILALRILTLTDEEKRAVREGDARARLVLERTEALPPEHWAKLHGAVRGLRRATGEAS